MALGEFASLVANAPGIVCYPKSSYHSSMEFRVASAEYLIPFSNRIHVLHKRLQQHVVTRFLHNGRIVLKNDYNETISNHVGDLMYDEEKAWAILRATARKDNGKDPGPQVSKDKLKF